MQTTGLTERSRVAVPAGMFDPDRAGWVWRQIVARLPREMRKLLIGVRPLTSEDGARLPMDARRALLRMDAPDDIVLQRCASSIHAAAEDLGWRVLFSDQ